MVPAPATTPIGHVGKTRRLAGGEVGLVDALGGRDRIAFMREEHRSQFTRYQCGLEDGKALLRLSTLFPSGMTRMEGPGPARSTTQARVDRRPSQAPPPVHVESRR